MARTQPKKYALNCGFVNCSKKYLLLFVPVALLDLRILLLQALIRPAEVLGPENDFGVKSFELLDDLVLAGEQQDVVAVREHDDQVFVVLVVRQLLLQQVDLVAAAGLAHVSSFPLLAHTKDLEIQISIGNQLSFDTQDRIYS